VISATRPSVRPIKFLQRDLTNLHELT
jgi:hypothetical protein